MRKEKERENLTRKNNILNHKEEKMMNKKIEKDQKARQVKTINAKIKYVKLKKGINRNKDQNQEIRWNEYCKKTGSTNTKGRKKYTHTYPTTSKIEWDKKEQEKKGETTAEERWILNPEKEIKAEYREEPIILVDETGKVDVYKAKVNDTEKEIVTKVWKPETKRRIKVKIKRTLEVPKELIKVALENGAAIYELVEIL